MEDVTGMCRKLCNQEHYFAEYYWK